MAESLFEVMAKIAPERSVARSGGDIGGMMFSGIDPVDGSFLPAVRMNAVGKVRRGTRMGRMR